jgi:hypothetical protein
MDEVSFGPSREIRPPSRRRRALTAAVLIAGAAAAGVAFAVTAHHAMTSQHPAGHSAALAVPLSRLPSAGCPPADAVWPSLAGLPAGMRPGALPVIIDAQFSGRCTAP